MMLTICVAEGARKSYANTRQVVSVKLTVTIRNACTMEKQNVIPLKDKK